MNRKNPKRSRQALAALLPIIIIAILLCIPYTNGIFVGVFGYAVYAYMIIALISALYYLSGKNLSAVPKRNIILYVSLFFSLLITLHIGLAKDLLSGGFGSYVIDPFLTPTTGGMLLSIISCVIAVPLGYTASLVIFFLLSAGLLFASLFPLFVKGGSKAAKPEKEETETVEKKESPFFTHELPREIPEEAVRTAEPKTFGVNDDGWSAFFKKVGQQQEPERPSGFSIFDRTGTEKRQSNKPDLTKEDELYFENTKAKHITPHDLLFSSPSADTDNDRAAYIKPTAGNATAFTPFSGGARPQEEYNFAKKPDNQGPIANNGASSTAAKEQRSFTAESVAKPSDFVPPPQKKSPTESASKQTMELHSIGDIFLPNSALKKDEDSVYDFAGKGKTPEQMADFERFSQNEEPKERSHVVREVAAASTAEQQKVYSEPKNVYGEPQQVYGEQPVVPDFVHTLNNTAAEQERPVQRTSSFDRFSTPSHEAVSGMNNPVYRQEEDEVEEELFDEPIYEQEPQTEAEVQRQSGYKVVSEERELPPVVEQQKEESVMERQEVFHAEEVKKAQPTRPIPTLLKQMQIQNSQAEEQKTQAVETPPPVVEKKEELPPKPKRPYVAPHLGLLDSHKNPRFREEIDRREYEDYKEKIESTLAQFGIKAEVVNATKGPIITRYEFILHSGSVSRVANLKLDLAMKLATQGVDIIVPLEGKETIGVDIPHKKEERDIVSFRDIIASQEYQKDKNGLKIALGKSIDGSPVVVDLEAMPHLLVGGATGQGKSVCINTIITSLLFQHSPDEVKLLLIDPKLVEMVHYTNLPHLLVPEPLNDLKEIVRALRWVETETKNRFAHFKAIKKLSISAYNEYAMQNGLKPKCKIVVVIDEASELMSKAKKETEEILSSIARIGRAAGVHLIFATQSPVREVITSEIQNNLNTKIAFAVSDYVHSMVILKTKGAEQLIGRGDMYIKGDGSKIKRVQCSFISGDERERVIDFIINNNDSDFDEDIYNAIYKVEEPLPSDEDVSEIKRMPAGEKAPSKEEIKHALIIGFRSAGLSTSLLQRKMGKGFAGAARIIDYLTDEGYIEQGEPNTSKRRRLLISVDDFLAAFPEEAQLLEGVSDAE